ncbi:hypothetical protein [Nocardia brasiliensis]|uniref:hypothetical protein n=1 Tax=Nocardia brasiliensis TaxID=37326 RepID=UPI002458EA97|nr:hypothetical protein [Nocardia brasiliensis]
MTIETRFRPVERKPGESRREPEKMADQRDQVQPDPPEVTPTGHFLTSIQQAIDVIGVKRSEIRRRLNKIMVQEGKPTISSSTFYDRLSKDPDQFPPEWGFVRPLITVLVSAGADPESAAYGRMGTEQQWKDFYGDTQLQLMGTSPVNCGVIIPPQIRSATEKLAKAAKEKETARILTGRGVMDTLRQLYPRREFVRLWGQEYPITAYAAPESEFGNWEAVLAGKPGPQDPLPGTRFYSDEWNDSKEVRKRFVDYNNRFEANEGIDRRAFYSGSTYAFERLWFDDGAPRLDCKLGRYFASIVTSEELDLELMKALKPDRDRTIPLSELPEREWLHDSVRKNGAPGDDPVINGSTRAAALSHATAMFVDHGPGGYDLWLPFRSQGVATHAYFNHVAPSGIFSPHYEDAFPPLEECSVERNFFREWVEELYAQDIFERPNAVTAPDPEAAPEVIRLKKALREKLASLYYTGVSVNLLTLRPEICLALVIHDPAWLKEEIATSYRRGHPMQFGWEWEEREQWRKISTAQSIDDMKVRITTPDLRPHDTQPFDRGFLVPNAAAAISLGLQMLKQRSAM